MLKGWVLTDDSCQKAGCRIPLMRSPSGRTPMIYYCASCDENQISRLGNITATIPPEQAQTQPSPSVSSSSRHSRSTTPLTEFSSTLSSPTFAPPMETAESLWRRQQSDTASSEIAKRLLKGWAMLAEECQNMRCFGVPLVRPPNARGGKDPRKECVICGTVYVSETDSNGWERLVPVNLSIPEQVQTDTVPALSSSPNAAAAAVYGKEQTVFGDNAEETSGFTMPSTMATTTHKLSKIKVSSAQGEPMIEQTPKMAKNTSLYALEVAAKSLEQALHALSEQLTFLSNGQSPLNPLSITSTAEAIGKVAAALERVKKLRWSESRVVSSDG